MTKNRFIIVNATAYAQNQYKAGKLEFHAHENIRVVAHSSLWEECIRDEFVPDMWKAPASDIMRKKFQNLHMKTRNMKIIQTGPRHFKVGTLCPTTGKFDLTYYILFENNLPAPYQKSVAEVFCGIPRKTWDAVKKIPTELLFDQFDTNTILDYLKTRYSEKIA